MRSLVWRIIKWAAVVLLIDVALAPWGPVTAVLRDIEEALKEDN